MPRIRSRKACSRTGPQAQPNDPWPSPGVRRAGSYLSPIGAMSRPVRRGQCGGGAAAHCAHMLDVSLAHRRDKLAAHPDALRRPCPASGATSINLHNLGLKPGAQPDGLERDE